ncbi:MAG TPA: FixH family protein [Nitrospirota bacterium]|nr:FixH family protein [Nitrospirota bacterium]
MRFLIVIIVLVCVIALAATIGTIIIGTRNFEGTVVGKPYETGLAWDETRKAKEMLGWTVDVEGGPFKTGKDEVIVKVLDKEGSALLDAVVTLTVSRPSTNAYNRSYQTIVLGAGRYSASIDLALVGNWDIIIDVSRKNDHDSFKKTIFAGQDVK